MRRSHPNYGFTLVELLVVIGIIALLISILLPALNSARRSANQVKCASQMKQLANAYFMYANDNRGWYPPAKMGMNTGFTYSIGDVTYPFNVTVNGVNTKVTPYWYDFIAKYVTKTLAGNSANNDVQAMANARKTVLWACPAWEGYVGNASGDLGVWQTQMGIGPSSNMSYSESNPAIGANYPHSGNTVVTLRPNGTIFTTDPSFETTSVYVDGNFPRQVQVSKRSAERMLFADSRYYITESKAPPADRTFPAQAYPDINTVWTAGIDGQTLVDVYRHGKTPPAGPKAKTFATTGGKVAYNVLYCDGHVAGANDQSEAYRSYRLRYPG